MATIFNSNDAPMGSRPETEGLAADAFDAAHEGQAGMRVYTDMARVRVNADPGLNDLGKKDATAKMVRADFDSVRRPRFERAKKHLNDEEKGVADEQRDFYKAAGLEKPTADSAAAIRQGEIRQALREKKFGNEIISNGMRADVEALMNTADVETLAALFHAPSISGLVTPQEKSEVGKRVLQGFDAKRYARLEARRNALSLAQYGYRAAVKHVNAILPGAIAE